MSFADRIATISSRMASSSGVSDVASFPLRSFTSWEVGKVKMSSFSLIWRPRVGPLDRDGDLHPLGRLLDGLPVLLDLLDRPELHAARVHQPDLGLELPAHDLHAEDGGVVPPEERARQGLDLRGSGHSLEGVPLVVLTLLGGPLHIPSTAS